MWIAITREVSPKLGDCELSFVSRHPIDVDRARAQHAAYCHVLGACGCEVIALPAESGLPDSVFVEDAAIVLDELAIITRPGAASRRDEAASLVPALGAFRRLVNIQAPATIDGGDVLCIGRDIHVGQAGRSNAEAIAQLRTLVTPHGYRVHGVPTHDCLHLKSAVTQVADDTLLVQPAWVDTSLFAGFKLIEVDPDEEHAANALRIGDSVVYPDNFPRTARRLADAGIAVTTVDVSELQKAEGATTCCSLVFRGGA